MKNPLKNWQGLWALIAMLLALCAAPTIVQHFWPLDVGFMPGSYMQALVLWQAVFFAGIVGSWAAFQLDWREIDKQLDAGEFLSWFNSLTPGQKIVATFSLFFALLAWQACSLWLVASLLS